MANPHRGEVAFKAGDADFTLVYSTNAICELEDALNRGLNAIVADIEKLSTVRALLWAGLRTRHPDTTMAGAGEIIDKTGVAAATEAIGRALNAAFPKPEGKPGNV